MIARQDHARGANRRIGLVGIDQRLHDGIHGNVRVAVRADDEDGLAPQPWGETAQVERLAIGPELVPPTLAVAPLQPLT